VRRDDSHGEQKAIGNAFMMAIVHVKGFGWWPNWGKTEAGSIADDDGLINNGTDAGWCGKDSGWRSGRIGGHLEDNKHLVRKGPKNDRLNWCWIGGT
jgi:hypothetical protein